MYKINGKTDLKVKVNRLCKIFDDNICENNLFKEKIVKISNELDEYILEVEKGVDKSKQVNIKKV
ncbi:hypothetical protein SH1V18_00350 [Vallitalea longa]|uniref:Spo0E like sporulation regulatory protein n=1 Tax=Vallitalea longa TaxID=2936439 RepID=A0A9W6DD55_9FIRM|nr:Spo0E family sporulation regulatory protein-aspartic acid phosphatase [Vallitalea longa]GKX27555.1 hypothetical protein SH1V18_00350 [Vallitalea longa]